MAGGMTPKRGLTLAERSALSGSGGGSTAGSTAGSPEGGGAASRPVGRHCWVRDPPGAPGRWPGLLAEWLLTEWRPVDTAPGAGAAAQARADRPAAQARADAPAGRIWLGRVVYAIDDGSRCVLVETWLPAGQLEPVDGVPAPSGRGPRTRQ